MFIRIREKLQVLEQVQFRPIRSIVWLKSSDFDVCLRQDKLKRPSTTYLASELDDIIAQREHDATLLPVSELHPRSTDMQHGKFPSNVVQGIPQIGNDIANNETPSIGCEEAVSMEFDLLRGALYFGLFPDGALWLEMRPDAPFESVDVYIRPLNLEPGAIVVAYAILHLVSVRSET